MDTHGKTQEESPAGPRVCSNGCGFFANEPSDLCSQCNRELQAAKQNSASAGKSLSDSLTPSAAPAPLPAAAAPQPQPSSPVALHGADAPPFFEMSAPARSASPVADAAPVGGEAMQQASPSASPAVAEAGAADERPVQKNTSRCFTCKKKIGLTGFKCRCGYVFCGSHRLAEAHECDFDYKTTGRDNLAKANPLIQADRITRF